MVHACTRQLTTVGDPWTAFSNILTLRCSGRHEDVLPGIISLDMQQAVQFDSL